jgi:hypothetical protein
MAKELNKEQAAHLFDRLEVNVTNTRIHPRQHKGNVVFCGYADFQINIDGIPVIQLCGNSIKLMGDQVHFDPKSEAGRGERQGQYFPHWFPMTAEARAALTELIKRDPQIDAMCREAIEKLNVAAPAASGNPFSG